MKKKASGRYAVDVIQGIAAEAPDDLFLCCTSFEKRCTAAAQKLSSAYRARLSCIFRFMPSDTDEEGFDDARDHNAAQLASLLKPKTLEVDPATIICNKHQVEDGVSQLCRILDAYFPAGCRSVTIDMSSFTKIYFWQLMLALIERYSAEQVRVLYTHSKSIPSDALTAGAYPPLRLPRFAGKFSPARRTLLLGFVGFEPQRAILIYEEFEPDRAELFVTFNPDRPEYFQRALKANEYLLTRPGVRWARVSPYDPFSALKVLEEALVPNQPTGEIKNIILMSLGTKVQNLAGFLFWCRHPEVHLAYAFPTKYAKDHLRLNPGITFSFLLGPYEFSGGKNTHLSSSL